MALKCTATLVLVVIAVSLIVFVKGASQSHYKRSSKDFFKPHKKSEHAQSRSYIDIDASDPFKVPKSSQYIDQPVPEFTRVSDEREHHEPEDDHSPEHEEAEGSPMKNFDNIQEDLKQMGLDKIGKSNSMFYSDKGVNSQDDAQQQQQPVIEQEGAASNDPIKPVEIGDVDQTLKILGDPQSRHSVPGDDDGAGHDGHSNESHQEQEERNEES